MTKEQSDYSKKLLDPQWQKKRLEILNRDEFKCQWCGDVKSTLHVHHKKYENGLSPWEYPDESMITLCSRCHSITHLPFEIIEDRGFLKVQDLIDINPQVILETFSKIGNYKGDWSVEFRDRKSENDKTCDIGFLEYEGMIILNEFIAGTDCNIYEIGSDKNLFDFFKPKTNPSNNKCNCFHITDKEEDLIRLIRRTNSPIDNLIGYIECNSF